MLYTRAPKLDPHEQHFRIPGPRHGLQLFLRHLAPITRPTKTRIVLYVHGATFPSALLIAHRFDGVRVIRDYGMFERREAPQYYPDVTRREEQDANAQKRAAV